MKKSLLLAMALMAGAAAANAADLYLVGGFNGWTVSDPACKFTEGANGEYTLDYKGTLTSGFKINDGSWNGVVDLGGDGSKLVANQVYNLRTAGPNIETSENFVNPHIVLNIVAGTLLVSGQTAEAEFAYAIKGDFTDPGWSDFKMTEKDGLWSVDINAAAAANFGIKQYDTSNGGQTDWIFSAGESTVILDSEMPCVAESKGTGKNFAIAAGNYTFTFDPEAMLLTVVSKGGEVVVPPTGDNMKVYWNNAGTGWEKVYCHYWGGTTATTWPGVEMALEGDKYVIELPANSTGVIFNNGVGGAIGEGQTADLTPEANKVYSFESAPEPVELGDLYVVGDFCDWKFDNAVKMSRNGLTYTAENVALAGTEFKVASSDWKISFGAGEAQDVALSTPTDAWFNSQTNFTYTGTGNVKVTFVVDEASLEQGSAVASTLTLDVASGVEEVEVAEGEAVYFNLQGVKVANPTNGIFVKVLNGKATKVVVND